LRAWIAPLDRHAPPKQVTPAEAHSVHFASGGELYFQTLQGSQQFVLSAAPNQTAPRKTDREFDPDLKGVSPRGDLWLSGFTHLAAYPPQGGTPIPICDSCTAGWGLGGRFLCLRFRDVGEMGGGKTIALAILAGQELPKLPASGVKSASDMKGMNVAAEIDMKDKTIFAPGPDPSVYAYVKATVQRNIFRIPLK
jgi:hypothetical protein